MCEGLRKIAQRLALRPLSSSSRVASPRTEQNCFGRSSPVILRVKDLRRVPSPPAKMTPHSCSSCLDSPVTLSVPARSIMVTSFKAVWKLWIRILIRNTRADPISHGGISSFEHLRHDKSLVPNCGFPPLQIAIPYGAVDGESSDFPARPRELKLEKVVDHARNNAQVV